MGRVLDEVTARAATEGLLLGPAQPQALRALDVLGDGVYLWGPAGRGKTWLLEAFTAATELRVARYHWFDFFTRLHQHVARHLHSGERFTRAVDALLGDCEVLRFDELQLTDLDDTWMVERLLTTLQTRRPRPAGAHPQPVGAARAVSQPRTSSSASSASSTSATCSHPTRSRKLLLRP